MVTMENIFPRKNMRTRLKNIMIIVSIIALILIISVAAVIIEEGLTVSL